MNPTKPVVLVVDDVPDNLTLASALLQDMYRVKVATGGERALGIAAASPPDLILLDVMMPGLDGYETCRRLKADPALADIPVIFLTAKSETEDEEKGFEMGAVDYIVKPLTPALLRARVKTHLALKQARDFLADRNAFLEQEVARRVAEITRLQELTIVAMASLAETRDHETGAHIKRTSLYVEELARRLSSEEPFREQLTGEIIELLAKSAPLHDIGKMGIPEAILWKPGRLTTEEFEVVKMHPTIGRDAIVQAERLVPERQSFLVYAKEMAFSHHEKWDGTGYPLGLKGEEIPLSARLMAIADVYDALVNRRVYKAAFSYGDAVAIIKEDAGTHFDPAVVAAFLSIADRFRTIAETFKEEQ